MGYEVTNRSTQFGFGTPHGFNTPHRFPIPDNLVEEDLDFLFLNLASQLYPTGRAFYINENSNKEKLHNAINDSFVRLLEQARLVIDKNIPDNENFVEEDALLWEQRLGLFPNPPVSIEVRRNLIARKLAYPSGVQPRLSREFIESQLRASGFDVRVYPNRFENGETKTPNEVLGMGLTEVQHGGDSQHGIQHGATGFQVIANSLERETFSVGENLEHTFFISGGTIESRASVPANREREFRELVLKLKPARSVVFPLINFV